MSFSLGDGRRLENTWQNIFQLKWMIEQTLIICFRDDKKQGLFRRRICTLIFVENQLYVMKQR